MNTAFERLRLELEQVRHPQRVTNERLLSLVQEAEQEAQAAARVERAAGRAVGFAEARELAAQVAWDGRCTTCGAQVEWSSSAGPGGSALVGHEGCSIVISVHPPQVVAKRIRTLEMGEVEGARTVSEILQILNQCWGEVNGGVAEVNYYDRKARQRLELPGPRPPAVVSPEPDEE